MARIIYSPLLIHWKGELQINGILFARQIYFLYLWKPIHAPKSDEPPRKLFSCKKSSCSWSWRFVHLFYWILILVLDFLFMYCSRDLVTRGEGFLPGKSVLRRLRIRYKDPYLLLYLCAVFTFSNLACTFWETTAATIYEFAGLISFCS